MINAIEWFKEKGFTFDDNITIRDVISLQNDARKDGLMSALSMAIPVINRESAKYSTDGQQAPRELIISALSYVINAEADKLDGTPP